MGNYSQYKFVNTVFGGTTSVVVPTGTSLQQVGTTQGQLRYNTDKGLAEIYTSNGWSAVDAPPTVASISGVIEFDLTTTITITGSNFKSGSQIYVTGAGVGNVDRAMVTTYVNSAQLTFTTNATSVNFIPAVNFGIKVTNPSGLSGTLDPAGVIDREAVWSTPAGTYTVYDVNRGNNIAFTASDPDGATVTYSLVSGSLPGGASLTTSTGQIGPFNAVGSDTTSSFTLGATSTSASGIATTINRSFSITVKAPIVASFTSVGTSSFSVPTGLTTMRVLVIGGGGGGANGNGSSGGGGGGGTIEMPAFPVTPGGSVPYQVGGPGGIFATGSDREGSPGGDSYFGTLYAYGGGGGGGWSSPAPLKVIPGGSGGGAGGPGQPVGGTATQPTAPGNSGTYGYGYPGGGGTWVGRGGGGGGAGGAGVYGPSSGAGGPGRVSTITGSPVTYAGGGGGGSESYPTINIAGGPGGPGGGGNGAAVGTSPGQPGTYYGGGGGAGTWNSPGGAINGGTGYQGIIIIRY